MNRSDLEKQIRIYGGNPIKKSHLLGATCACSFLFTSANASIAFYTDKFSFDAVTTTSTVDFEGIVGDTGFTSARSQILSDITFTTSLLTTGASTANATICGKDACSGYPHDSALFVADQGTTMIIDLTTVSYATTAVGGIFGDIDIGSAGNNGVFAIYGLSGLLDTQSMAVADMGSGSSRTFFGWTTSGGDVITRIEFYLSTDRYFASADDFQFGAINTVPLPPALYLFGAGLLGLVGVARRKKQR